MHPSGKKYINILKLSLKIRVSENRFQYRYRRRESGLAPSLSFFLLLFLKEAVTGGGTTQQCSRALAERLTDRFFFIQHCFYPTNE